ncbi:hypothetical protein MRX96_034273 [Rhipicephalus microplus]
MLDVQAAGTRQTAMMLAWCLRARPSSHCGGHNAKSSALTASAWSASRLKMPSRSAASRRRWRACSLQCWGRSLRRPRPPVPAAFSSPLLSPMPAVVTPPRVTSPVQPQPQHQLPQGQYC